MSDEDAAKLSEHQADVASRRRTAGILNRCQAVIHSSGVHEPGGLKYCAQQLRLQPGVEKFILDDEMLARIDAAIADLDAVIGEAMTVALGAEDIRVVTL